MAKNQANMSHKGTFPDVIRFMWRNAKKYPRNVIFIVFLTVAAAVLEGFGVSMLVPIIERFGFSGLNTNGLDLLGFDLSRFSLEMVLLGFIAIQLIRAIFQYVQQDLTIYQEKQIPVDLQHDLLQAVLRLRWPQYRTMDHGKVVNVLVYETKQIGSAFNYTVNFFSQLMIVIAYLIAGLYLEWRFTSVVMILGFASLILFKPIFKRALQDSKETIHFRNILQHTANSHILNLKTIRSMGLEGWSLGNFRKISEKIKEFDCRVGRHGPFVRLIFEPIAICFLVVGIYVSIAKFSIPFSTISVLMLIFVRALPQISQIQGKITTAFSLMSSAEVYDRVLEEIRYTPELSGGDSIKTVAHGIRLRGVSVEIGNRKILDNIDFEIPSKKITAIVGPSGSGKSTLLDCILGLYQPSRGEVLIDGKLLSEISLASWRNAIGYVGHESHFFELPLRENLLLGDPTKSDEHILRALEMAGASDFVKKLSGGLDYVVRDGATNFSYGQKQRLALARALVREPKVLILDEATNGLDNVTENSVLHSVQRLSRSITVILVSHKISNREIADQIIELKDGRLIGGKSDSANHQTQI